jgi:hypothetical protein
MSEARNVNGIEVGIGRTAARRLSSLPNLMAKTQHQKDHNREYQRRYRAANPDYMQQWRDSKKSDPEYMERRRSAFTA